MERLGRWSRWAQTSASLSSLSGRPALRLGVWSRGALVLQRHLQPRVLTSPHGPCTVAHKSKTGTLRDWGYELRGPSARRADGELGCGTAGSRSSAPRSSPQAGGRGADPGARQARESAAALRARPNALLPLPVASASSSGISRPDLEPAGKAFRRSGQGRRVSWSQTGSSPSCVPEVLKDTGSA